MMDDASSSIEPTSADDSDVQKEPVHAKISSSNDDDCPTWEREWMMMMERGSTQ
jgi:hypothetical protein